MNKRLAATIFALAMIGSTNAAEGFGPWNDRVNEVQYTVMDSKADNGFAPWKNRDSRLEAPIRGPQVEITESGFRPWVLSAS